MNKRKMRFFWAAAASLLTLLLVLGVAVAQDTALVEQLGGFLYEDTNLSDPDGQGCASCHDLNFATVDPDTDVPVSEGVIPGLFGNRNSPMAAYAMYVPPFHFDSDEGLYIGGLFWDGRATGEETGDPLADQALGPPLNPLEMHNPDKLTYVRDVKQSSYSKLFKLVWGDKIFQKRYTEEAYLDAALAIAAFERSAEFARFSSKYDLYLYTCVQEGGAPDDCAQGIGSEAQAAAEALLFSDQEWEGLQLFMAPNDNDGKVTGQEGAGCSACHVANWTQASDYAPLSVQVPAWAPEGMVPPLFTDHSFDNLGTPRNPNNPWYYLPPEYNPDGEDWVDYGLGGFLQGAGVEGWELEIGKHRVMTLRNIGLTPPYLHNGVFDTLLEVTHFYNARDVDQAIPGPEVPDTVNFDELGDLGLSPEQEAAIVAFMEMLSDGYW